jgi:hypothetical protein
LQHDYTYGLQPYIFVVLYDSRIDLATALHCGLLDLTRVPALASNALTITAQTSSDSRNVIKAAYDEERCQPFFYNTLSLEHPPYTSYSFNLESMGISNTSLCDRNAVSGGSCISETLLRFGTGFVNGMESKPGIGSTEILINEGAIVGTVQFFMSYLSIYYA